MKAEFPFPKLFAKCKIRTGIKIEVNKQMQRTITHDAASTERVEKHGKLFYRRVLVRAQDLYTRRALSRFKLLCYQIFLVPQPKETALTSFTKLHYIY